MAPPLWPPRRNDAAGCWVAEDDEGLVGIATSLRHESWWGLSSFWVSPDRPGGGVGKSLLDAALRHGDRTRLGMICASHDPKAFRRYRLAGFTMHPTMTATGTVDRSTLPAVGQVRDGTCWLRPALESPPDCSGRRWPVGRVTI